MESRQCLLLLLLTAGTLRPCPGEPRGNDDGVDPIGLLRNIYGRLLVRAEPFVRDSELKELRRPAEPAVTQQTEGRAGADGPVAFTKNGQIKGVTVDKAHVFYGVRYADPPVGAYRWKPPRPVSPWSGVYDASFPRPACMQVCSGSTSSECPKKVRNANIFCSLLGYFCGVLVSKCVFHIFRICLQIYMYFIGGNRGNSLRKKKKKKFKNVR